MKTTKGSIHKKNHFRCERWERGVIAKARNISPTDDGLQDLALAVLKQAVIDYLSGKYTREASDFFFGSRSHICKNYLDFCGIDEEAFYFELYNAGITGV